VCCTVIRVLSFLLFKPRLLSVVLGTFAFVFIRLLQILILLSCFRARMLKNLICFLLGGIPPFVTVCYIYFFIFLIVFGPAQSIKFDRFSALLYLYLNFVFILLAVLETSLFLCLVSFFNDIIHHD